MTVRPVSRRDFLKAAGITLGGAALVSGLGAAVSRAPAGPVAAPETPVFAYGRDQAMQSRILVTYATRTGSTVGVAAAIGETLSARGFAVDVVPSKEKPRPEGDCRDWCRIRGWAETVDLAPGHAV